MRTTHTASLAALLVAAGCGLGEPAVDYGDPTEGGETDAAVELALVTPEPYSAVDQAEVAAEIRASHASGVTLVEFTLNGGPWELALPSGSADRFEAPLALRWGVNDLRMRATAGDGRQRVADVTLEYTGSAPMLVVDSPVHGGYAGLQIAVTGRAAAVEPATLIGVEVQVDGGGWVATTVAADNSFTAAVAGSGAATQTLEIRATDSDGLTTTLFKTLTNDDAPPSLTVDTPSDTMIARASSIEVSGVASDDTLLDRVEVQVGDLGWIVAPLADDGGYLTTVNLAPGPNTVQVRAIDGGGNTTLLERAVFRARQVTLSPFQADDASLLTLTLDKNGLEELIPEEDADSLDMLYLDLEGLLLEALKAMKDYTLYGVDTSSWGAAEWNMHKILTMSPDTADVTGTSLEEILTLSQNLGIPVPVVLGDLADIAPTDVFLTTEQLAQGVMANILASHPGLVTDPADGKKKIPISLGDAFKDLTTLGDKLGPMGGHPGILFEASPAQVLLPNFAMTVTARSNLRQHDAVDLSGGKTYLFARPAGLEALEFDFLNPEWFKVQGLADEPEVDLAFLITEHNTFVPAGSSKQGNPVDGFERGTSPVWDLPTWTFEYLVADMMFQVYHPKFSDTSFTRTFSYDVGSLTDAAVIHWDKGWLLISTLGGVGDPPPAQYFWDAVLELAQVRLHDGGLAEGDADLQLEIPGVRVPLTAAELVEATRPVLEAQNAKMAEIMVGDLSTYSSDAELFLAMGDDGNPYLYFVAADDVPGLTGSHGQRGLYADAELTQKVSTTESLGSGDTVHEKVAVSPLGGEEYYAADLDGTVWKLTLQPMAGSDVKVMVEPGGLW